MSCINNDNPMHRNDINYVSLLGVVSRRRGNTDTLINKRADLELQQSQCMQLNFFFYPRNMYLSSGNMPKVAFSGTLLSKN